MNRRKKDNKSLYHICFTVYKNGCLVHYYHKWINIYNIDSINITKRCENEIALLDNETIIIQSVSKLN